jgi:hypothetical protein
MMRDFYFDFIGTQRHLPWVRGVLLLLGLLSVAAVGAYYQLQLHPKLLSERQALQEEMAKLGVPAPVSSVKPAVLAQAWQSAHSASVELSLPWQAFFVEIGRASGSGEVALLSIEPDPAKGNLVLVAEGRDLNAMLRFISDLQKSPTFSEVALQSHTINRNVPEKPVRFRLTANWRTAE